MDRSTARDHGAYKGIIRSTPSLGEALRTNRVPPRTVVAGALP